MTLAETLYCKYNEGNGDRFYRNLFNTIISANDHQRNKLSLAYPELVGVVTMFEHQEGYRESVETEYKKVYG